MFVVSDTVIVMNARHNGCVRVGNISKVLDLAFSTVDNICLVSVTQ